MWQSLSITDLFFALTPIRQPIDGLDFGQMIQDFLFLGIIPATRYQLDFEDILYGLIAVGGIVLIGCVYKIIKHTINILQPKSSTETAPVDIVKFSLS